MHIVVHKFQIIKFQFFNLLYFNYYCFKTAIFLRFEVSRSQVCFV